MPCRTTLTLEHLTDRIVPSGTPADPIVVDPQFHDPAQVQPPPTSGSNTDQTNATGTLEELPMPEGTDWDAVLAAAFPQDPPVKPGDAPAPVVAIAAPPPASGIALSTLIGIYQQREAEIKARIQAISIEILAKDFALNTLKDTLTALTAKGREAYQSMVDAVDAYNGAVKILNDWRNPIPNQPAPTAQQVAWAQNALKQLNEDALKAKGVYQGVLASVRAVKDQAASIQAERDKLVKEREALKAELATIRLIRENLELRLQLELNKRME